MPALESTRKTTFTRMVDSNLKIVRGKDFSELVERHTRLHHGATGFDGFGARIEDVLLIVKAQAQGKFRRRARCVERIQHHSN